MSALSWIRMHGCGNDYVFIDAFNQPVPPCPQELAQRLSDRHRSVGGDGLVLMLPSSEPDCHARMRMFNSDGSEGSLCGNALRCMALWLHHSQLAPGRMTLEMHGRRIHAEVLRLDSLPHISGAVRIALAPPQALSPHLPSPARFAASVELADFEIPGLLHQPLKADPGNPHLVLFIRQLSEVPVERLGPALEGHTAFPNRTNVEFAELLRGNAVRVRVWERGSGETLACGSGACAVALAGAAAGLFDPALPIHVHMTGGQLIVSLHADGSLQLEGPAEECCRGLLHL
jgi:diaminopimelate epimerase